MAGLWNRRYWRRALFNGLVQMGGKFQIDQGPGFGIQAANATLEQRDFQGFEAPDMGQIDGWEGLQRRPTHDDTSRVMVKRAERAVGDSPGYLMWVRQASCCV